MPKPPQSGCARMPAPPMASADRGPAVPGAAAGRVRCDKWLWAARFYKTRSLAAQALDAGQARLAGNRVKPAHGVCTGNAVSIHRRGIVVEVIVTALSDRRGSATEAAKLYRETDASIAAREADELARRQAAALQPRFAGRPTKRERRKLEDFLNEA
jgi:ribosome-associated heat shock protein Hsp15